MSHRTWGNPDRNQPDIIIALQSLGYQVQPLSAVGGGVPDLLVTNWNGTRTFLIEVKRLKQKLTPAQVRFHDWWKGEVYIIDSVESTAGWPELFGRKRNKGEQ